MKEVTEWDGNSREMWVWDGNLKDKKKRFVVYVLKKSRKDHSKVLCLDDSGVTWWYHHCAEIEPQRLMTHKELSRWLREKPDREWVESGDIYVHSSLGYTASEQDEPVRDSVRVREGDSPWFVPFKEV